METMWPKSLFNKISNTKSKAWNVLGISFFEIGHIPTRVNQQLLEKFLENIPSHSKCCIVGASTLNLIKASIERGLNTTVVDFSAKMCKELRRHLGQSKNLCTIKLCDMTNVKDVLKVFKHKYDYILTDQVINCFNNHELDSFLQNISKILEPSGEFRVLVNIGLYDIDNRLITKGKELGTVNNFFDPNLFIIDYSKAVNELKAIFPKKLFRHKLCNYYSRKGVEMRFADTGIDENMLNHNITNGKFKIIDALATDNISKSILYRIKWLPND